MSHPARLSIDSGAVAAGNANPAQEILDVHATHGDDLGSDMLIYVFGAFGASSSSTTPRPWPTSPASRPRT